MVVEKRFNNPFFFLLFKTVILPGGTKPYQKPFPIIYFNFTERVSEYHIGGLKQR